VKTEQPSSDPPKLQPRLPSYVLVTPARNEQAFIELTLKSVIAQTVLPIKWIIVSDGSTDDTDMIVGRYASKYAWIELLRTPVRARRHFAGKVNAFNAGYAPMKGLSFDLVGNLDADISFDRNYFHFLLCKFQENPRLGVAGTPFSESGISYDYRFSSIEHVSGACQLFRRECFEAIGGYVPLEMGGVDLVAVITARMMGWETRTFTEMVCTHHRKTQSAKFTGLTRIFRSGYHDYLMGGHFVWQFCRSAYQMRKAPWLIGGCLLFAGYCWAIFTRADQPVSRELVAFRRKEQMRRLKTLLRKAFALDRWTH
jgi:poly-beta-1,6-N-acetyl-D-glucosamine synthase